AGRDPNIKERNLRAKGSLEQIYGLGCDWLIVDDVVTTANSGLPDQRDKLESWFLTEALSRLEPGGKAIVLGTRFFPDDLYGRLVSRQVVEEDEDPAPLWDHVVFPALADPDTGAPSLREDAVSLWPERWTCKKLLRQWANFGQGIFETTWQQSP